jgi:hypothetical protein
MFQLPEAENVLNRQSHLLHPALMYLFSVKINNAACHDTSFSRHYKPGPQECRRRSDLPLKFLFYPKPPVILSSGQLGHPFPIETVFV